MCADAHIVDLWVTVGYDIGCDWNAGEKYLENLQSKVSSVDECKKLCEDADGCQSIIFYYTNGWCSHLSTQCTRVIDLRQNTVVLRLSTTGSGITVTSNS